MRLLYLLLLLVILFNCQNIERNCNNFKTGKFYSEISINGKIFKSEFFRTRGLQVEHYNNKVDSSQVRWINDCEVVFKSINPKNISERKDIHLKILTTTDSSYTFEYSYVGEIKKQKGIAFKAN
ncbi:DNA topoisomerase IV [Seonamhaeicola aphaedonensis]|uniref:DNA topoisomerase IV n=1 Tax=Seonamhaeicola aphaedonensis TaxID=1461338 RepID=A0A3D9HJ45_9FLAO|nr:DNA topoisomerase IV [Seonamhaeicola aphaedonensis]RED49517.1 hypothetical protein DFQ02_102291 [Seonamhaeicola aphaedonensis]